MAKRIVIVGGGFAGLKAAKALASHASSEIEVIIIDRRNHHLFQPLLYQVATAGLSPAEIASPIRGLFPHDPHIHVMLDTVEGVHPQTNTLSLKEHGEYAYDYLIMACGAKHSYFGRPDWEDHAPGLKTLEQATEIRRRILTAFEKAETETDPAVQQQHLTFVIVGGGPTGVELAGAISEIARHTLKKDFRRIDPSKTRVLLIEAGPRVLAAFDSKLSAKAEKDLQELGIEVKTNTRVTEIRAGEVQTSEGTIRTSTVIWAAGVQPSKLNQHLESELDRAGRVKVKKDLSLPKFANVFVVGDQACFELEDGKTLPGLASVAMQQGHRAGQNILADLQGKVRTDFQYFDKGQMATIGRRKAIAQMGGLKVHGFFAWLMWLFIHIYYLIGFRNKITVFLDWVYAYFTFKKGARLITSPEWRTEEPPKS